MSGVKFYLFFYNSLGLEYPSSANYSSFSRWRYHGKSVRKRSSDVTDISDGSRVRDSTRSYRAGQVKRSGHFAAGVLQGLHYLGYSLPPSSCSSLSRCSNAAVCVDNHWDDQILHVCYSTCYHSTLLLDLAQIHILYHCLSCWSHWRASLQLCWSSVCS